MDVPREKLSIIMPAFYEGHHIYANVLETCHALQGHDYEVIVVDDGSPDSTYVESRRAAAEGYPVQAVRQEINQGKGAALFYGLKFASGDLVAFLDSDLEIAPHNVIDLWHKMKETGADVVVGTKELEGNSFPPLRRAMSRAYRALISALFDLSLSETQTGIKLFRREVLELCVPRLQVRRMGFDVELLIAASHFGFRAVECPVKIAFKRKASLERIKPREIVRMFWDTLSVYYRSSFWFWLQPAVVTKMWIMALGVGLVLLGIGLAKLLAPLVFQPPLEAIFYILTLRFLPPLLRNWLFVVVGMLLIVVSLVKLNKSLLKAFGRRDRGDLSGILTQRTRDRTLP